MTTINSYVSALKSILKEDSIEVSEDRFLLNSLVRACRLRDNTVTICRPIQKPLLHLILKQVDCKFLSRANPQPYLASMYKALFVSAYYGFLRIGEVVTGTHSILAKDVHIGTNKQKLLFILRSSKTHLECDPPQSVKISSSHNIQFNRNNSVSINQYCPYSLLRSYLSKRVKYIELNEPFFIFRGRSPVRTYTVEALLKDLLRGCGMNPRHFSFHSLRAGCTVDLLKLGVKIETIQNLRWWKSNTIFTYLNKFN